MKHQHTVEYDCPVTDKIEEVTIEQISIEQISIDLYSCSLLPRAVDFSTKLISCTSFETCNKKCILELEHQPEEGIDVD